MSAFLWVLQSVLAAFFLIFGGMKVGASHDVLVAKLPWVASAPGWLPRFVGAAELLGALGLVVPGAIRTLPWLTQTSSAALAFVMLLAVALHFVRNEPLAGVPAGVACVCCIFVASARTWIAPIS
jgi:uncharacterized membrane protein